MTYISEADFHHRVEIAARRIYDARMAGLVDDEPSDLDPEKADWEQAEYQVHQELQLQEIGITSNARCVTPPIVGALRSY